MFNQMETKEFAFAPRAFVNTLRQLYPMYAEQEERSGAFK